MIKQIDFKILCIILFLIPFNQVISIYSYKFKIFEQIALQTNYLILPTLLINIVSISFFSILIFYFGKLRIKDFFLNSKKLIEGLKWVLILWIATNLCTIIYEIISVGKFKIANISTFQIGKLFGQLFGNALLEEILYRGLFLTQFYLIAKQKINNKAAVILAVCLSQVLFSLAHIPNRFASGSSFTTNLGLELVMLFLAGVILSIIYIRTQNLIFLIGGHSFSNYPINLIQTDGAIISMIVILLMILIAVFWTRLAKEESQLWIKKGLKIQN